MMPAPVSTTLPQTAVYGPQATDGATDISFGDVLRALNPLQYMPGVGTIYRAITGDKPPEVFGALGSILVGGLIGGPVGAVVSAVSSLVQHASGINLDEIMHHALVSAGISIGLLDETAPQPVIAALPITPSLAGSATAAEAMKTHVVQIFAEAGTIQATQERGAPQIRAGLQAYGKVLGHA